MPAEESVAPRFAVSKLPAALEQMLHTNDWCPVGMPVRSERVVTEHVTCDEVLRLTRRIAPFLDELIGGGAVVASSGYVLSMAILPDKVIVGRGKILSCFVPPYSSEIHFGFAFQALSACEKYTMMTSYCDVIVRPK